MHIFQNGSLVIHDVAPEDSGRYTCIAGNSCNIKHTEAPLYVVGMTCGGVSCTGSGAAGLLSHQLLYIEGTPFGGGDSAVFPPPCDRTFLDSLLRSRTVIYLTFYSWDVYVG